MGRKLQLRRGPKSQIPTLLPGEPAWVTDENKLYIGTDAGINKEVSTNAHTDTVEAVLDPAGWIGTGPYTQNVYIAGMTSVKNGMVGLNPTASSEARTQSRFALLQLTAQSVDSVTITADGIKPTVHIPIVITMIG